MVGIFLFAVFIFLVAFICEFIDSHLGGGYGTILSPLFIAMGFPPLMIVHSILISEVLTGFEGGIKYHQFKEVDLKSSWILGLTAGVGSIGGTLLALGFLKQYISIYIGILVTALGLLMALKIRARKYKRKRALGLGVLIGFNKALTGGGFGPICVAGLSMFGMKTKKSLGTTLLAEGITCVASLLLYFILGTLCINLIFLIPLVLGAVIGCYFGSERTKKVKDTTKFSKIVGVFIFLLGITVLIKKLIL